MSPLLTEEIGFSVHFIVLSIVIAMSYSVSGWLHYRMTKFLPSKLCWRRSSKLATRSLSRSILDCWGHPVLPVSWAWSRVSCSQHFYPLQCGKTSVLSDSLCCQFLGFCVQPRPLRIGTEIPVLLLFWSEKLFLDKLVEDYLLPRKFIWSSNLF